MELNINYIIPGFDEPIRSAVTSEFEGVYEWLDGMIRNMPDAIFFFTIPSTDLRDYWDETGQRHFKKDLSGLNSDGSPCEVCKESLLEHEWADLDHLGFVVNCSNKETV